MQDVCCCYCSGRSKIITTFVSTGTKNISRAANLNTHVADVAAARVVLLSTVVVVVVTAVGYLCGFMRQLLLLLLLPPLLSGNCIAANMVNCLESTLKPYFNTRLHKQAMLWL